jgi:hypothetical protein
MGYLGSGEWMLLMVYEGDKEYAGFFIVEAINTFTRVWLSIPFGYSQGSSETLRKGFKWVEDYAKTNGFTGVKIYSSRKGYERWANRLGYKKRLVEFVKEF